MCYFYRLQHTHAKWCLINCLNESAAKHKMKLYRKQFKGSWSKKLNAIWRKFKSRIDVSKLHYCIVWILLEILKYKRQYRSKQFISGLNIIKYLNCNKRIVKPARTMIIITSSTTSSNLTSGTATIIMPEKWSCLIISHVLKVGRQWPCDYTLLGNELLF